MAATVYRLRNWARYQHYKHRSPPWIKLHYELLSSPDWVTLEDASRVLAIACMLLASRSEQNDGTFCGDAAYVKRVAYLNKTPNFKPLIECGFIEVASTLLADASASVQMLSQSRDRVETETELEGASAQQAPQEVSRKKARTPIGDFSLTDDLRAYALARVPDMDVAATFENFRDHHLKLGQTMASWPAAFRTWVVNCQKGFTYVRTRLLPQAKPPPERISFEEYQRRKLAAAS